MKAQFYALALVLGLSPLYAASQQQTDRDRDQDRSGQSQRDRDDQNRYGNRSDNALGSPTRAHDLQNTLRQRYPNSNISVGYQNNNTFVVTGNALSQQDRQNIDQWVRSYAGRNVNVIDQLTVNGANAYPNGYPAGVYPNRTYGYPTSTYPNGYPNGTYPNGTAYPNNYPNNGYPNNGGDRDRDRSNAQPQGDRDNRTDADRNRMPQSDVDARNAQNHKDDKDKDKKNKNNDKDKDKKKDKDKDKDNDRDNQPR